MLLLCLASTSAMLLAVHPALSLVLIQQTNFGAPHKESKLEKEWRKGGGGGGEELLGEVLRPGHRM